MGNTKKKKNYNKNNNITKNTSSQNKTKDKKIKQEEYHEMIRLFAKTANKLQINNLSKVITPAYNTYSKEDYRNNMANPGKNEKKIREMSQFLSRVSMPYKRILWYFATIYCYYWNLTPRIDPADIPDREDLLIDFNDKCRQIEKLNLSHEMKNILYFTLRDGVFYGFIYEDDENAFIYRLNPDYCRPIEIEAGVYNIAFDFSYFKKFPDALECWDSSFQSGYNQYEKDSTNMRWQILDPQRTICVKADPDVDEILPFFSGIFEALIDLIDARTLQRNKDIIQNYKLILQKIPFFDTDGTKTLDDFKLELDTILQFSSRLEESIPEAVGVATTPMEIDTIDFKTDDNSSDLNSSSMKQVFDDSGVTQLIFNSGSNSAASIELSVKTDASMIFRIINYLSMWVQRYINYKGGNVKYKFEFLDVNVFNKDTVITREMKLANSGVPNKMKLATSSGMTPTDVINNQLWENDILDIVNTWIPLQTSFTMSGGRPAEKDIDESQKSQKNLDSIEKDGKKNDPEKDPGSTEDSEPEETSE